MPKAKKKSPKKSSKKSRKPKASTHGKKIGEVKRRKGYLAFVDAAGNVREVPRKVGGKRRKRAKR